MKIVHCLFEQSGTFKKVFKEYGHKAYDYDILDDYGETDFKIDLFAEIEKEYENISFGKNNLTIFSKMTKENDFIIAFFPCTYFTGQQEINFRLQNYSIQNDINKNGKFLLKHIDWVLKAIQKREYFFSIFIKFCFICEQKEIPTIIENPNNHNYLEMYSPYRPSFYEKDRSIFGDDFKKPTLFFAINFDMKEKFEMFYDKNYGKLKTIRTTQSKKISTGGRSEITTRYAKNFYQRFMLNKI